MSVTVKRLTGETIGEGNTVRAVCEANDANLGRANLGGANLGGADLYGANLRDASLRDAYLGGADLCGANLGDANLCDAYLGYANLCGANLRDASLYGADLRDASLCGANLRDADLRGASLRDASLCDASLGGVTVSWSDHNLLAEILWRAAGDSEPRQMLAAFIGRKFDWCWDEWAQFKHPERDWALDELAKWVKDGDGAPKLVRALAKGGETDD